MALLIIGGYILLTAVVYFATRRMYKLLPSPFTTPVFLSTIIIIMVLVITGVPYSAYEPSKDVISYALGPATVALAVPVYKNRKIIMKQGKNLAFSLVAGSTAAVLISLALAQLFNITQQTSTALSVKSATVPIAMEIAALKQGDMTLTAIFVMVTGLIGAMFGPRLLTLTKVSDPVSRGLAIGTIAHGIGTAHITSEGEIQGAVAGSAMAVAGVYLSFLFWLV
ncbi:LrgB family protein [Salipaludibacillus sp. CUR1]|uniref:LrgB family protein n=1 Tax=Salipaludibacillus sp. CUR1 TaxID=2820003 RepID=UPI001E4B0E9E|nr:LrgB family protein [Salipaludibacillus sp. CUR1]MCE7794828.1 LrgB family protein [Salipaludibacillus sp. CUR1]